MVSGLNTSEGDSALSRCFLPKTTNSFLGKQIWALMFYWKYLHFYCSLTPLPPLPFARGATSNQPTQTKLSPNTASSPAFLSSSPQKFILLHKQFWFKHRVATTNSSNEASSLVSFHAETNSKQSGMAKTVNFFLQCHRYHVCFI